MWGPAATVEIVSCPINLPVAFFSFLFGSSNKSPLWSVSDGSGSISQRAQGDPSGTKSGLQQTPDSLRARQSLTGWWLSSSSPWVSSHTAPQKMGWKCLGEIMSRNISYAMMNTRGEEIPQLLTPCFANTLRHALHSVLEVLRGISFSCRSSEIAHHHTLYCVSLFPVSLPHSPTHDLSDLISNKSLSLNFCLTSCFWENSV